MTEKKKNIICSIFFFLLGAFLFYQSLPIKPLVGKDLGSGYVPKIVAITIMIISLIEATISFKKKNEKGTEEASSDRCGGMLTICCICSYVALFGKLGFIISTAVYLFIQMIILSTKTNKKMLLFGIISIISTLVIYIVFNNIIGMQLPGGILDF